MEGLSTQRLWLRPVEVADADQVHDHLASDFEVVRHTGTWPWPADFDVTGTRCQRGWNMDGGWMVALQDGNLVGMIGLQHDGDLGYMLARPHWGQGYATEMGRAIIDHAKGSGRWPQLKACVFDDNPASVRVMEKLGFVEGGACRGRCEARAGEFPIRTFTMQLLS